MPEQAKDQPVRVIKPGAVEFGMSRARKLAHLSRAKIAVGDRGYHLGGMRALPAKCQMIEDFMGQHASIDSPADRFAARIADFTI